MAATLLTGTMATAIHTVHGPKGPWVTNGGYEYNLVLMAIVFALTDVGPGAWSVDAASGHERWGAGWAVAQLAAGRRRLGRRAGLRPQPAGARGRRQLESATAPEPARRPDSA